MQLIKIVMIVLTLFGNLKGVSLYPAHGFVTRVEPDRAAFVDTTGNEWEWFCKDADSHWMEADEVSALMCDMGTEDITDDMILSVRYDGF